MDMFLPLLLLVAARIGGEVALRLGQAPLVGEIAGGVVLGIVVAPLTVQVPVLAGIADGAVVDTVVNLGIFFLILSAGIEMEPREIARGSAWSFAVAVGGMAAPGRRPRRPKPPRTGAP